MGYIDPGAFGIISQIGYVVLFALVTGFMFFFNPIKRWVSRLVRRTGAVTDHSNTEPPQT